MIIYGTYECQEFSSRNLSICFPVTNAMVCITQTRSHTQVSNHSNNIGTEYVFMQEWAKLWANSLSACSTSQLWNKNLCLKPNSSSVHRTCLQNIEFSPCFHHGSLFIITFLCLPYSRILSWQVWLCNHFFFNVIGKSHPCPWVH